MKINWLGHSCFLLETNQETKVITDPYESGSYDGALSYDPINSKADVVTVSHQHNDHNNIKDFKNTLVIDSETKTSIKDISIEGMLSYHDNDNGRLRGENIIFTIYAEGLKIVHFGDLGTKDIELSLFKDIDVALVPIGGTFTIDAVEASQLVKDINPKITIPMHYKTSKLKFDIDGVDKFLKINCDHENKNYLEINQNREESFKRIVILKHQR